MALCRFIINDSYRSDVCLLHPPHLVAIAALVLAVSQHSETREAYSPDAAGASAPRDIVGFLAGLNVSMPAVTSAVQDLLALYAVWARVRDEGGADLSPGLALAGSARGALAGRSASPAAMSGAGVTSAQLAAIAAAMRERWFARLGAVMGQDKRLSRTFAAG
jgi:cyclin C